MKKVTKFLAVVIAVSVLTTTSAFAQQGGFEVGLSVPLGVGIHIPSKENKDSYGSWTLKGQGAFEWGVALQPGWKIGLGGNTALSLLLDLAYRQDVIAQKLERTSSSTKSSDIFNSFQIGLYPKFNIGNILVGIGGGVKIPMSGGRNVEGNTTKLSSDDLKNIYKNVLIPYIKLSGDYAFYLNDKNAILVGIYAGYDFGLTPKYGEKSLGGAFDVGAQVGYKFGPK